MTDAQAKRLGRLIHEARIKRGWSLMQAMEATGIDSSWLNRMERGFYADPAPDRLAVLAENLDIDPAAIDRASRDHLADSLPNARIYFRSKEKLSAEALDEVEAAVAAIRAKYSQPASGDAASEPRNPKGGAP
jgi:transcriptional regulator with XRE-family HTH domain